MNGDETRNEGAGHERGKLGGVGGGWGVLQEGILDKGY